MKVKLNKNLLFVLIIFIIIIIGYITIILSPTWYKVQFKILSNNTNNITFHNNSALFSSSSQFKFLYSDYNISRFIPYYLKTKFVIKNTIISEIPDWLRIFYDEDKLEDLVYKFQNEYINVYNIPNTKIYLVEVIFPSNPILCKNIALQLFYQLENKLQVENNNYLNNKYKFLQSALSKINMQIKKTENSYLEYVTKNRFQNDIKNQHVIDKYEKKLTAYNDIYKTTRNQLDLIMLAQQNQQSFFFILEKNLNPVIKYKPFKSTILSVTFICVLVLVIIRIMKQKEQTIYSE